MIYLTLFLEFFKIGLFTFGGGLSMIPLIEQVVYKYDWITQSQFIDFLGICESTPGPIAINMATYIGSTQAGLLGSIAATLGVVMPSFIIIILIASILKNFAENKYVKAFLKGVKPVVIALILSTGTILLAKTVGYVSVAQFDVKWISVIIFALICVIYFAYQRLFKKKLSAIGIILSSAILGLGVSCIKALL